MIGEECARTGIGVFHLTFSPVSALQLAGRGRPSATPLAATPRNCGQDVVDGSADRAVGGMNIRALNTKVERMRLHGLGIRDSLGRARYAARCSSRSYLAGVMLCASLLSACTCSGDILP